MHGLALGGPGGGAQGAQFVPHYPGMMQVIPAPAPGYASLPSMEGGAGAGQLAPSEEPQQPPQPERGQSN